MIGRRVGSWILERELGRGGMGAVFQAKHASLQTRAAVKVLSPGLESEESFRLRFHREAELQAQLRHSNVARVLDYLEDGGQWFLVVEYLNSGSLADLLSGGGKVAREQAVGWVRQALAGLGHAHQKGIVHRDVKPANLMLSESSEIVVVDFGIARAEGVPGLTGTGVAIGTPQYMSPEQIVTPDLVDWRTDIYSLGIVLYELLAGKKPFDAGSQYAILQAHVSQPPPPLRSIDPSIPPELDAIVMRALAKKPEQRYADCAAMSAELEHKPVPMPRATNGLAPTQPVDGPVPLGGTIRSSVLFEPAVQQDSRSSAGEIRDRKRRVFQRQLVAATFVTIVVASILALKLGNGAEADTTNVTSMSAVSTVADAATITTTTTGSGKTETHGVTDDHSDRPHEVTNPRVTTPVTETQQPVVVTTQPPVTTPTPPTASAAPQPPPMPPLPERPRIAVIGAGQDPLLAGALEQTMEQRLDRFDVHDERGDPEVGELLKTKGAKVTSKELGAQLLKSGFQVLVLLNVEEAESRTVNLREVTGSVKAARITMNGYLLPANRTIGSGWTELVEYSETSAAAKARQAFIGPTADLRKAISDDYAQFRAATGR